MVLASRAFLANTSTLSWPGGQGRSVAGKGGLVSSAIKREGDGASPIGRWPMREVFYRPDRVSTPVTALPVIELNPETGWCDDPGHPDYNRRIVLPFPAGHEKLWRADHVYDLIVVLGWNDDPVIAGKGSAIFLHLAQPDWRPTEGCIATGEASLRALLEQAKPGDALAIAP